MNNKKIVNVFWIDDEHKKLTGLEGRFKRNGIKLFPAMSKNKGIEKLKNQLDIIDAILLDGKILENDKDEKGTEDTEYSIGLISLFAVLPKKLEVFILTGQSDVYRDSTFKKAYKKIYHKGQDEDIKQLIEDLKQAAEDQPQAQIRHKYQNVFDVLSEDYLGVSQSKRLMNMASELESNDLLATTEDRLISLRKIIEGVFGKFVEIGVIPSGIKNEHGWITNSSKFLAGMHSGYTHNTPFIPPVIAELFHRILNITQDGAHGDGNLRFEVDSFIKSSSSDYLYRSSIFGLFEILVWFKKFIDLHPNKEENLDLWERIEVSTSDFVDDGEWKGGLVTRIAENRFGTLLLDGSSVKISIPPRMVSEFDIRENDRVKVTTKPSPDGSQTYINEIEKVR